MKIKMTVEGVTVEGDLARVTMREGPLARNLYERRRATITVRLEHTKSYTLGREVLVTVEPVK